MRCQWRADDVSVPARAWPACTLQSQWSSVPRQSESRQTELEFWRVHTVTLSLVGYRFKLLYGPNRNV